MASDPSPRLRDIAPVLLAMVIAVGGSLALARADNVAARARLNQTTGLTRGAFVDRHGRILAYSTFVGRDVIRRYALPDLSIPIGYQDPSGAWHGLEARYNGFLEDSRAQRDWRSFFLNLRGGSVEGGDVQLTLDARLQKVADNALGRARGAVVAIQPSTGAVLAYVSKPACSPATLASPRGFRHCTAARDKPLLNRPVQRLVAPGSAFKIVTLSAALDTKRYTLQSRFSGADAFGPSPYFNNLEYPSNVTRNDLTSLTMAQALAFSDNFTFAHIGLTLGAQTLIRYARRFYVGLHIPFAYPAVVSRVAGGSRHPSLSVLARSSFGARADLVTPLQMALIAAAVANHGVLMRPYLVSSLIAPDGAVVRKTAPEQLDRVMSAEAARQVTKGMVFVVNHGSGFESQIKGVGVAGKTGTAADAGPAPHAWFIAFAPASHPVVAVAVLHEYGGEGFSHAAPIARKVLVAALQEAGYSAS